MRFYFYLVVVTALLLKGGNAYSQIPVELFAGNKKTTFDQMFFKYFKGKEENNSPFLFFSRTRASVDYKMTTQTNLPSFGLTEAFSYNATKLKGFAPVGVVQIFNRGIFPKAGIQLAKFNSDYLFFSWLVCETLSEPDVDYFLLFRYMPELSNKIRLFTQFESVNTFPSDGENKNFIQRFRLGLKFNEFQFGAGADLTETGKTEFTTSKNFGGFLRYEFK